MRAIFVFFFFLNTLASSEVFKNNRNPQSLEEEISAEIIDKANCKIIINSQRISGLEESQVIHSTVKNKVECEERGKVHGYNLFPKEVKSKNVEVIFEEKN